jgi:hypothetical protein
MSSVEKPVYKKLPGKGPVFRLTGVGSRCWYSQDHLLLVTSEGGYLENYKRFYYRDIQALIIRKTNVYRVVNWVCGVALLFLFLFGVLAWRSSFPESFFGLVPMFLIFLSTLVGNLIAGDSRDLIIQTAVQRERLGNLSTQRSIRKGLDILLPLIHSAQEGATPPSLSPPVPLPVGAEPSPDLPPSATHP